VRALVLAAAAVALAPSAALANPAEGLWRTQTQGGVVRVGPCGAQVCGWLHDSPDLKREPDAKDARNRDAAQRDRKLKGLQLLSGFSGGPARWTGGMIYNPDDGRSYRSELTLADPNTLKVKGCLGPICRTQTWTRVR
jgi:uncharacterized protein (DUF2147 family)